MIIYKPGCKSCSRSNSGYVPYDIPARGHLDLVLVGEAPGQDELIQQKPFVGRSGQLLRNTVPAKKPAFLNTCQCGTSKPSLSDIRSCGVKQAIQIYLSNNTPVVLLGEYALKAWFDTNSINVTQNRGYLEPNLYASYHPASCLRDSKYTKWMKGDIQNAYNRYTPKALNVVLSPVSRVEDFPTAIGESVVFDVETTGVVRGKDQFTVGCIYRPEQGKVYQISDLQLLRLIFAQQIRQCTIIGHNVKFDMLFSEVPYDFRPVWGGQFPANTPRTFVVEDTQVLMKITHSGLPNYALERLAEDFLGYQKWWVKNGKKDKFVNQAENCGRDCIATWGLYDSFRADAESYSKPYEISTNAVACFSDFEKEGIPIDTAELNLLLREHTTKIENAEKAIFNQVRKDRKLIDVQNKITNTLKKTQVVKLSKRSIGHYMNLNSNDQKATLLYNIYGIPPTQDKSISKSVDSYTLTVLEKKYPIAKVLHDYTKITTDFGLLESIRDKYLVNGHIYPQHAAEGARTGRTAASKPNIQQYKKTFLKRLIKLSEDECLGLIDWSQIELRVLAYISQDPVMLEDYKNNVDQHAATQVFLRNLGSDATRDECKPVNFGLVYGLSEYGLQRDLYMRGIDRSIDFCRNIIEQKKIQWPGVAEYMAKAMQDLTEAVNPIGRKRILTESAKRSYNQKLNHPVQSFANDISLTATYWLWLTTPQQWGRILGYIHDAIIFIVKKKYLLDFYWNSQKIFSNWILCKILDNPESFNLPIYGQFNIVKKG